MNNRVVTLLNEYLDITRNTADKNEHSQLKNRYSALISDAEQSADAETKLLVESIFDLTTQYVIQKIRLHGQIKNASSLTDTEIEENAKVQRILDLNLLTYHFQPIVRADTGEIFSYEALMRPKGVEGITPFHILKYAEMTERLDEIEKLTFMNVLSFIDENKELFGSKFVFINSMPNVHIDNESFENIQRLFERLSDNIVVEMTENSEYGDKELGEIKDKFRVLNIPIAIDDYGTGYSNISNLLRYTPDYVKIDRALLSGIQDNPNKKHFVREIVDFCHANNIMALAEGVENSEELRTVILLGVDLIQGFYTARPSAQVIAELPYKIRAEIKTHHQELEDGRRARIYSAQKGEKVNLDKIVKDGYDCLMIGADNTNGSVTVAGSQYSDTDIHIEIAEGYCGEVVLDSASLYNITGRPCIDINKDCSVSLVLKGTSRLRNGGIRVPPSSKLTFEGLGNIDIQPGSCDYYGIGNDTASNHGDLYFKQDGTISISANSHSGVLIGSGMGGHICIERGRYVLSAKGSFNVCLGALDGNTKIELHGCDFEGELSGAYSVVVGSIRGDADIHTIYSSVKCDADSQQAVAMGVLRHGNAKVTAESVNMNLEVNADDLTALGSLCGSSEISIMRASLSVRAEGSKALLFGGKNGGTAISFTDSDISAKLDTNLDRYIFADEKDIHTVGGKYRITFNSEKFDRIKN